MKASGLRQLSRSMFCKALPLALLLLVNQTTYRVASEKGSQGTQATGSSIEDLRKAFRSSYNEAIAFHSKEVVSRYPIITQDLLNMTLIRSNGSKERYTMDRKMYSLMANTSHPPLTIYSILSKERFGELSDRTITELQDYLKKLSQAQVEVHEMSLDPKAKASILSILKSSGTYLEEVLRNKKTSLNDFEHYVTPIRRAINESLRVGAQEQLIQFKRQVAKWRSQFPDEKWRELRVVVLGFHQPREQYVLKLFFEWLLREPGYERRIVYAEFQSSISGADREKAEELALLTLTKVDFELEVSSRIFGSPKTLQVDVMGPAAVSILRSWGASTWPD